MLPPVVVTTVVLRAAVVLASMVDVVDVLVMIPSVVVVVGLVWDVVDVAVAAAVVVVSVCDGQESVGWDTSARLMQSTSIHSNGILSPRSHGRGWPPSTGIMTSAPRWSITMSASGLNWPGGSVPTTDEPTLSALMAMTTLCLPSWRVVRTATHPPQRDLSMVVKSWPKAFMSLCVESV
jgi:hypothetical protein